MICQCDRVAEVPAFQAEDGSSILPIDSTKQFPRARVTDFCRLLAGR